MATAFGIDRPLRLPLGLLSAKQRGTQKHLTTMSITTITLNPSIDQSFSVARVIAERKLLGENLRLDPGGGGINVARVVSRLGGETRAWWSAGGENGRHLAQLLDRESVPHTAVPIAGEVRQNLVIRDRSTGEQYRFGLEGPTLSELELQDWCRCIREQSAAYVVFSGSLPGATSAAEFKRLLGAVPRGAQLIVDTKQEALRAALEFGVYLIKPNHHELEQLVERELCDDQQLVEAAREIIGRGGARVVVVSLGRGGALYITADRGERLIAPAVPIRSKVGAGDSMVGGITYALQQGRSLSEAVRLGIAAGSATVMNEGTELCRREDVERLSPKVVGQALP